MWQTARYKLPELAAYAFPSGGSDKRDLKQQQLGQIWRIRRPVVCWWRRKDTPRLPWKEANLIFTAGGLLLLRRVLRACQSAKRESASQVWRRLELGEEFLP